jgi:hypothetical protein
MEAICFSELSVDVQRRAHRCIPEELFVAAVRTSNPTSKILGKSLVESFQLLDLCTDINIYLDK